MSTIGRLSAYDVAVAVAVAAAAILIFMLLITP